ncbi:hypothetical protein [Streptomyces sp. NPDC048516]|uniref:hypothetical protein n=1 Tax=Streptomyces sp. NPDC048516 TaxID=3365565 RepID=UPI0037116842
MGIWTDAFMAPEEPVLLPREAFGRLVVDLARERVVRTPWALLAGELCVNASLNWGSVSGQARWDRPAVGTLLRSDEGVLKSSGTTPRPRGAIRTNRSVCSLVETRSSKPFRPCNKRRTGIRTSPSSSTVSTSATGPVDQFRFADHRTTLVCFALAHRQVRPLATDDSGAPGGAVHPVHTCLVHTFKHMAEEGPVPAITSVAARHFGSSLVSGESWG